jgi:hypothetical protein
MTAETATPRWLTPTAALLAAALAGYAWFGPLPFLDAPPRWAPPPVATTETQVEAVGADRQTDFVAIADRLDALRTPERQPEDDADGEEVEEEPPPPPPPEPLKDWRYSGYVGPRSSLVAILTLPDETQHAVTVGDELEDNRILSVSPMRVILDVDGEERSLTLVGLDPNAPDTTAAADGDAEPERRPFRPRGPVRTTPLVRPASPDRPTLTPPDTGGDDADGDDDDRRRTPRQRPTRRSGGGR